MDFRNLRVLPGLAYLVPIGRRMILKRNFQTGTRRSTRSWLNAPVQVFAGSAHMNGLSINLSDGGMCLFTIANLPVGSQIEVEFLPPRAEEPVRVFGKVRHRALYLYGVEFLRDYRPDQDCRIDRSELTAS